MPENYLEFSLESVQKAKLNEKINSFLSHLAGENDENELELHVVLLVRLNDGLQVFLHRPLGASLMPAVGRLGADLQSNTRAHSGQNE